jgi:hypothetical protein
VKVFVAGTASSSPAPSSIWTSAAAARALSGSFVSARGAVALEHGHDLGRAARLADAEREPAVQARLAAVERHEARRGERDRPTCDGLEQVAGEDRRVVGRAARHDDHSRGLETGERRGDLGAARGEPAQNCGLGRHVGAHALGAHAPSVRVWCSSIS